MEPFKTISGIAAPLLTPNVDTDAIIPKQFLKGIDRAGLRDGFLHDLRFDAEGRARAEFILNRAPWSAATVLIVGPNFGCGSSREHAVWAMQQFGIRALIGTTYGSIFRDNCLRNGVLAISLADALVMEIGQKAGQPASSRLCIELPLQTVTVEHTGQTVGFEIEALHKQALESGEDAVALTMRRADEIRRFETSHHQMNPWLAR
jgi:3-isopropylmalate/(R)-2-methylmalate dehydratase small subunit